MSDGDDKPRRRRRRRGRGRGRPDGEAPRVPARERGAPPAPAREREAAATRGPARPAPPARPAEIEPEATDSISMKIAWGDDGDAPTPEIALAPDLPADPDPGDPDPASAELEAIEGDGAEALERPVVNVAGIKFATPGKIYLYDAGDHRLEAGEAVAVEADRGTRIGTVAVAPARRLVTRPLKRILRRQSEADRRSRSRSGEYAAELLAAAKARGRELGLAMKIFRAELNPNGSKVTLYFSSEDKVDSRKLAHSLGDELKMRVEIRQIGVRDEAKMVGGIGSCGQELCCTTWLPAFVPVSIKNAKDQGLVLNPTKVSGQCGRLKCCLVYEQPTYAELRKGLPKLGKRVVAGEAEGRVVEVDVLRRRVRVNHGDGRFEVYEAEAVAPLFPSQRPAPDGERAEAKPRRSRRRRSPDQ